MCDFSLYEVNNRLAKEGEHLVIHKFPSISKGLASPADFEVARPGVLNRIAYFLLRPSERRPESVAAVCVPPGARLYLEGIPKTMQEKYDLSEAEEATFVQLTYQPFRYRDAFRFGNGADVLIQKFDEGVRVEVLQLALAEETEEVEIEELVAVANRSERGMGANG